MTPKKGLNFDPEAELVDPFDYLILGELPHEDELFAGAWPDGRSSKQLARDLFDGRITPSKIGPRMNALTHHGLVVKKKGMGTNGAQIYQRTDKGTALHKEWLKKQPAAAAEGSDSE